MTALEIPKSQRMRSPKKDGAGDSGHCMTKMLSEQSAVLESHPFDVKHCGKVPGFVEVKGYTGLLLKIF